MSFVHDDAHICRRSENPRIISLVPSITEIIYFLGLEAQTVGVTEHCNFPEAAKAKDKVGTFGYPELSKILSLKPDLVLADEFLHKNIINQLIDAKINVIAFTPSSVEDVFSFMSVLGRVCSTEIAVQSAVDSLRERVDMLIQKVHSIRPKVFRLMNVNPYVTPGPQSFQYDALRIAGAQLMDFKESDTYVKLSLEQIKEYDPDVILFCGVEKGQPLPPICKDCSAKNPICQRTIDDIIGDEWRYIKAVRENKVYPISCDTICRPGPRLIDGIEKLHNLLFV